MAIGFVGVRRVAHEEDRRLEAEYWASKTMAERVIAGWALAEDDLLRKERDEPEKRTGWILRRVVHDVSWRKPLGMANTK